MPALHPNGEDGKPCACQTCSWDRNRNRRRTSIQQLITGSDDVDPDEAAKLFDKHTDAGALAPNAASVFPKPGSLDEIAPMMSPRRKLDPDVTEGGTSQRDRSRLSTERLCGAHIKPALRHGQ
jgi:hypothetical protein